MWPAVVSAVVVCWRVVSRLTVWAVAVSVRTAAWACVAMASAVVVAVDRNSSEAVRLEAQAMMAMMSAKTAKRRRGLDVCIGFEGVETWTQFLPLLWRVFSPDGAVAEDDGLGVAATEFAQDQGKGHYLLQRAGVLVDLRAVEHSEASDVGHMDGVGVVALYAVGGLVLGLEADDCPVGLDDVVVARVLPPDVSPALLDGFDGGGGEGGRAVDEDVGDLSLVHDSCFFGLERPGTGGPAPGGGYLAAATAASTSPGVMATSPPSISLSVVASTA